MSSSTEVPARLAGRTLGRGQHICAFFRSRAEQNRILMPFFKEGIDRGEQAFHIIDRRLHGDHVGACREYGIDVDRAQRDGLLEIKHWEDAYLKDGYFDTERMLALVEGVVAGKGDTAKPGRLMGNMEWALETFPGVADLVEYESKLNYILPKYRDTAVCVYDVNQHSGKVVMDVLRTHPMVIIGGVLQENPLYVPPDEFLQELKTRKAAGQAVS